MRPKFFLATALLAFAAVAALWLHERSTARELTAKLSALRAQHRELVALESERWLRETDADHAHAALLLRDPDRTATPPVAPAAGPNDKPPPELPDTRMNKLTFLSLHRTASGWHLTVPATAIDRIAQEFAPPSGG